MYLEVTDVEAASPRDTPEALAQMVAKLQAQHMWSYLGEEGTRIQAVIGAVDPNDAWAILEAWDTHLRRVLRFPFAAEIAEPQERGPLHAGDQIVVQAITDIDDLYGLLVNMTHQRRTGHFPLCDLQVTDQKSPNYAEGRAYVVWFANR